MASGWESLYAAKPAEPKTADLTKAKAFVPTNQAAKKGNAGAMGLQANSKPFEMSSSNKSTDFKPNNSKQQNPAN
jgi:hypothetical protein